MPYSNNVVQICEMSVVCSHLIQDIIIHHTMWVNLVIKTLGIIQPGFNGWITTAMGSRSMPLYS